MSRMFVVSFNSTHHAMRSEKLLEKDFSIMVMPTPREISASCGISLRVNEDDIEAITEVLKKNDVDYGGVYCIIKSDDGLRKAEKILGGN